MKSTLTAIAMVIASLSSTAAMANYGSDAAAVWAAPLVAEAKQDYEQIQVALIAGNVGKEFNRFYQLGLGYQGQGIDQDKARQYVVNRAMQLGINDNGLYKSFVELGIQAINDGEQGRDFNSGSSTAADATPPESDMVVPAWLPTNKRLTCNVARQLPPKNADAPAGKIVDHVKGTVLATDSDVTVAFPYTTMDEKSPTPVSRKLKRNEGSAKTETFYDEDGGSFSQNIKDGSYAFNEVSYRHSNYIFTDCK